MLALANLRVHQWTHKRRWRFRDAKSLPDETALGNEQPWRVAPNFVAEVVKTSANF
jgi:hypothetical protein